MRWPHFDRDHPVSITYAWARRIAVALIGGTVLLVGVAMIALPGPAIVVIPLGLAILGLEFAWARRWLKVVKDRTKQATDRIRAVRTPPPP
jgi:tellurite resistance protein TerC